MVTFSIYLNRRVFVMFGYDTTIWSFVYAFCMFDQFLSLAMDATTLQHNIYIAKEVFL